MFITSISISGFSISGSMAVNNGVTRPKHVHFIRSRTFVVKRNYPLVASANYASIFLLYRAFKNLMIRSILLGKIIFPRNAFQGLLKSHRVKQNNAFAGSFFISIKKEETYQKIYSTSNKTKSCIFESKEILYSPYRPHAFIKDMNR